MKCNSHLAVGTVALLALMAPWVSEAEEGARLPQRQQEVTHRGATIMPFDLSRTKND